MKHKAKIFTRIFSVLFILVIAGMGIGYNVIPVYAAPTVTTFTSSGTFTPPAGVTSVKVLVVAGGGGGGGNVGGGGGGGGVIYDDDYAVTPGVGVSITVGNGGAGKTGGLRGDNGQNSVFGTLTAVGGGGGGTYNIATGLNGGSGGGGGAYPANGAGGSGTAGQGYAGGSGRVTYWAGGGGGGGGEIGSGSPSNNVGGDGGDGYSSDITGSVVVYAGGGGGCGQTTGGAGGAGGGGHGSNGNTPTATAGTANLGGGGGGARENTYSAGNGGKGVVIVSYDIPVTPAVTSNAVSSVEETTATLNGDVTVVNGTEITNRGFVWDTSSHAEPSEDTAPADSDYSDYNLASGSFGTGAFTYSGGTFVQGELYYVRACAENDNGKWGYGDEVLFLTKPEAPTGFTATGDDTEVNLAWTKGTGADTTIIRGKEDSYPANYNTDTNVYNDTGVSTTHSGLDNGDHWYYRAWSYATEGGLERYSDTYAEDNATPNVPGAPAVVSSFMVEGTGHDWAVLRGYIINDQSATVTTVGIEFGLTDAYGEDTHIDSVSYNTGDYFVVTIRGLTPGTTYHWRAYGFIIGSSGNGYGADMYLSTLGSPSLREYHNTGGDGDSTNITTGTWLAQQFTVSDIAHSVTNVRLYIKRVGNPGTITVSIKHANTSHEPTGLDIASGTIDGDGLLTSTYVAWDIEVDEASLEGGQEYAIVVRALAGDASNYVLWQIDTGGGLADAVGLHSSDGGVTWVSDSPKDYLFEIWGNDLIKINGGAVVSGYVEDGDLLFLFDYNAKYPPYYPNDDAGAHFDIRLYGTDGTTLIASIPLVDWGNRQPTAIYLSTDMSSSITIGNQYYLKLVSSDSPDTIIASYQLVSADWLGDDLVYLDKWVIRLAHNMESEYNATLVSYIASKGEVLNDEGGVIFDRGIQGLSTIRPDLFKTVVKNPFYKLPVFSNAFENSTDWETKVGATVAGTMTTLGDIVGISGKSMAQVFLVLLMLTLALLTQDFLMGFLLATVIALVGAEFRIVPIQIMAVLAFISVFIFVYKTWWSKT